MVNRRWMGIRGVWATAVFISLVLGLSPRLAAGGPAASSGFPGLMVTISLDKLVYAPGEPVRVTLVLANPTARDTILDFPSGQTYDVEVFREGALVWKWSTGKAFTQALRQVRLAPGERRSFEIVWDQRTDSGGPAAPGSYTARALVTVAGTPLVTTSVPFRIGTVGGGPRPAPPSGIFARSAIIGGAPSGEVLVNDRVALRMREPAGGLTPLQRAEIIAGRLREAEAAGMRPGMLRVGLVGGEAAIVWRGGLLVTVDRNHARFNHTTPMALARVWLEQLEAALRG